jgi:hypothetical protein
MVVPQSGTTGRCLVRRVGLETRASWRADPPARASTSAVAKTTHRASSGVRRLRCSPAVYVATSMSAATHTATPTPTRPPVAVTRIALLRLTSPISACVDPTKRPTKYPSVQVTASAGRAIRSAARQRHASAHHGELCGSGSCLTMWLRLVSDVFGSPARITQRPRPRSAHRRLWRSLRDAFLLGIAAATPRVSVAFCCQWSPVSRGTLSRPWILCWESLDRWIDRAAGSTDLKR